MNRDNLTHAEIYQLVDEPEPRGIGFLIGYVVGILVGAGAVLWAVL